MGDEIFSRKPSFSLHRTKIKEKSFILNYSDGIAAEMSERHIDKLIAQVINQNPKANDYNCQK